MRSVPSEPALQSVLRIDAVSYLAVHIAMAANVISVLSTQNRHMRRAIEIRVLSLNVNRVAAQSVVKAIHVRGVEAFHLPVAIGFTQVVCSYLVGVQCSGWSCQHCCAAHENQTGKR